MLQLVERGTQGILFQPAPQVSADTLRNLQNQYSRSTLANYRSSLKQLREWLEANQLSPELPLSAPLVADYLSAVSASGLSLETVKQRIKAIAFIHEQHELDSPTESALVKKTLKGMKRSRLDDGLSNTSTSKQPLLVDDLRALVALCDVSKLSGMRDRALLLVGFYGALRRSELVALNSDDVQIAGKGADIYIRRSKTDQSGKGAVVSIIRNNTELCPVAALVAWKMAAGITEGALFVRIRRGQTLTTQRLSARSVADFVKGYCQKIGLDVDLFAGHSLRSGLLTSAADHGADIRTLAQHARHANINQTMSYVQHANRFKNNPTEGLC